MYLIEDALRRADRAQENQRLRADSIQSQAAIFDFRQTSPLEWISMRRATLLLLFVSTVFLHSQQRPAITGIAFVRLYTGDPSASAAFYGRTLGFSHTRDQDITRYAVNNLQWIEVAPLPVPAPANRLAAVAFTTRDARALQRYLKAHSVAIEQPLAHGIFSVNDPEGNLIYFVQRGTKIPGLPLVSPNAASHRIIHAGFIVRSADVEDRFYRDLLGFRPYWHGGMHPGATDWVSLQVPDGTDWLEYMLEAGPNSDPSAKQRGGMNHLSLGVAHMSDAIAALARNHCEGPNCAKTQMGRDGKVQLNLFDPDLTRVEFMEFKPSGTTCCSPILGKPPTEIENR
jgi:catechol 2,3-dioxygenase-like lactoylglutathione lyase family enzyme